MTNFANLQFDSRLAGLENYDNDAFNFTVTAHSLGAGQATRWTTSRAINNTNAISTILLQYTLDSVWRYTSGAIYITYSAGTYAVETITYYSGSNLNVETYVVNQTGGSVSIPQFSVNIHVALFNAPF